MMNQNTFEAYLKKNVFDFGLLFYTVYFMVKDNKH